MRLPFCVEAANGEAQSKLYLPAGRHEGAQGKTNQAHDSIAAAAAAIHCGRRKLLNFLTLAQPAIDPPQRSAAAAALQLGAASRCRRRQCQLLIFHLLVGRKWPQAARRSDGQVRRDGRTKAHSVATMTAAFNGKCKRAAQLVLVLLFKTSFAPFCWPAPPVCVSRAPGRAQPSKITPSAAINCVN